MAKRQTNTKEIARDRLRIVLESDRGYLSGKTLELFKRDLATVMLSYMEIQEDKMRVEFDRGEDGISILHIEVPAVKIRKTSTDIVNS